MSEWISRTDRIPENNQYVLALYSGGNWLDNDDPYGRIVMVVKFRKGMSKEDRNKLEEWSEEWRTYSSGDEDGNNMVPYVWNHGGHNVFGQDVSHWQPLPEKPKDFS